MSFFQNRFYLIGFIGVFMFVGLGQESLHAKEEMQQESQGEKMNLRDSSWDFSFALANELSKKKMDVSISGWNIQEALALLSVGAEGNADRILRGIFQYSELGDLHTFWSKRGQSLRELEEGAKKEGVEFISSAKIYPAKKNPLQKEYQENVKKFFGALVEPLAFDKNPEAARRKINSDIAIATKKKIKELLPAGSVQKSTPLVLTSALYFKANFQRPFEKRLTAKGDFFGIEKNESVDYLHRTGKEWIAEGKDYVALRLPYKREKFELNLLLPREGLAIQDFLLGLSVAEISELPFRERRARVQFPKWKLESPLYSLRESFQSLGYGDLFAAGQFTKIAAKEEMVVDNIYHRTFFATNESGSEAAAATGIVMKLTAVFDEKPPFPFIANRPFLALLRETGEGGRLLFLTVITRPGVVE